MTSFAFRENVRSGVSSTFFTTCCVIVLPPWSDPGRVTLCASARSIPR